LKLFKIQTKKKNIFYTLFFSYLRLFKILLFVKVVKLFAQLKGCIYICNQMVA